MASSAPMAKATWEPTGSDKWKTKVGRIVSFFSYPVAAPFVVFNHTESTAENFQRWHLQFGALGMVAGALGHWWVWRRFGSGAARWRHHLAHALYAVCVDQAFFWFTLASKQLAEIFALERNENRLNAGKLYGSRVLIVGNGPSAVQGEPMGDRIDGFDEVVRFNNFQTKASGLESHVGRKTTVHFSDGVLYPTYKEYHTPGATVVLSLIEDRLMVAGSYFLLRGGCDHEFTLTKRFLMDPNTTWIKKEAIERLKKTLGIKNHQHPTSGMLAIDYFINKEGVKKPVVIHGFDFFQGPHIHYYYKSEPIYERVNNRIGVNMHRPDLEKVYVEKLIAEGKVKFLRDVAA